MAPKRKNFNKKKKGNGGSTKKSTTTTSGSTKVTTRTKLSDYKFNVGEASRWRGILSELTLQLGLKTLPFNPLLQ